MLDAPSLEMIVTKPWGFEFEVFNNGKCSVWCIVILPGHCTSMHMHKYKKASIYVVEGILGLEFLRDRSNLLEDHKTIIRPGLFHRLLVDRDAPYPCVILEIENSSERNDIIRLEDNYGRTFEKYDWTQEPPDVLSSFGLSLSSGGNLAYKERNVLAMQTILNHSDIDPATNYIITEGGISDSCGTLVAEPGDLISGRTMIDLSNRFQLHRTNTFQIA